jgi:hypothetical protein
MKRRLFFIGLLIFVLLAAASSAFARLAGYSLPWWTADSGGGASSGGGYQLNGTIGQPDAGTLSSGKYILYGGFWGGTGGAISALPVYLPLLVRP